MPNKRVMLNPKITDKKVDTILEQFEGLSMLDVKMILGRVNILLDRRFILVNEPQKPK